ncbi:hypothetical protein H9Q69_012206 [Fusarium xylarioides]|nr:hypothetical protein H9Q70_001882 [Fusarium xylarioides]KAG5779928.1 hypothetical protein H9Q73_006406 [Fusarium xylarioides]KAG5788727.1 hypothetical protein H9Q69_012206 [Fusarium xylarioides]KAG5816344.1 hypothetical protein H9Q74_011168 [Fusarium xylarioides]KAG5819654.1 hypothetical protein H9Q71_000923 [Fusarium xylarioides]
MKTMASRHKLLHTLRYTLGLSHLQDASQLAQVSQNLLEERFNSTPETFTVMTMGRIYMRWLINQDFTIQERPQSQVVEQWVSFVDCWGVPVEHAIALWAKSDNEDTGLDEKTEQRREKRNSIRHEIEYQFLKLKDPELTPPSGLVEDMPLQHDRNFKTRGQQRKFDEYNNARIKSALENWPTKDIPFSSIETAANTDTEFEEAEEVTPLDMKGEHGEASVKKKARLDTGGSSSL